MFDTVGVVGTGAMGSAVARLIAKAEPKTALLLSNRTRSKAEVLAAELKNADVSTNEAIAKTCGLIFLAVKPQMMRDVLSALAPVLRAHRPLRAGHDGGGADDRNDPGLRGRGIPGDPHDAEHADCGRRGNHYLLNK